MNEPSISIQRHKKKIAIYDGFECVFDYEPYENEERAIKAAREKIAKLTDKEPEILYPGGRMLQSSQAAAPRLYGVRRR